MGIYEVIFEIGGHLCHQKPERSFFIMGYQFPFCARCSGVILGGVFGLIFSQLIELENFYLIVFLCFPMVIDGLIQKYTSYISNNQKRLITGLLFGFGFIYVYTMFIMKLR